MKIRKGVSQRRGVAFVFVVLMISLITVSMAIGFSAPNIREHKNAIRDNFSNNAYLVAEAGNEEVFYRIKNGMNVPSEVVLTLNESTATTSVTTIGSDTTITTDSAIGNHTRKSQLRISSNSVPVGGIDYAAHVGDWGIEAGSNAEIKAVLPAVGDVYSNGPIFATGNNVTVTGNAFAASNSQQDNTSSSTSCVSDQVVGQSNPVVDHAQSFIASTSSLPMHSVNLFLKKNNNPQSKTVRLVADDSGEPDTTTITSGTLDRNKVTSVYTWVTTTFDTEVNLVQGNTYWIVLDTDRHNNNYYVWCLDGSDPFASGDAMYTQNYSSPSWSSITGDLAFQTFFGEITSTIDNIDDIQGDAHADSISDSTIFGDVYYQIISGSTVLGDSYQGSPSPDPLPMPLTDTMINAWKSAAEAGGTISGNCPGTAGCSTELGPVKIDGDWSLSNNATTSIHGTVYVTGNFTTDNNVVVDCDASYGSDSCVIIADGYMDFRNNSDFQGSGSSGSFILLVTTKDDCTGTSGTNCTTGFSALYHSNNAATGGIFFAQDSYARLENNAAVSSVIARGVYVDNNAELIYDTDLKDLNVGNGGGGGGGGWLVEDWREVE